MSTTALTIFSQIAEENQITACITPLFFTQFGLMLFSNSLESEGGGMGLFGG